MSLTSLERQALGGFKAKAARLETENERLRAKLSELEDAVAALTLDLARARDRITRVTRERDRHHRAYTDADAVARQRGAQLDAIGDQIKARLTACLTASADDPGKRHLAAAVRQMQRLSDSYDAIRGTDG